MKPFLFSVGSARVPSFFFFIMIAVLAGTFYCCAQAKKYKLKPEVFLDLGIIGMLAGIIGSRLFHVLVEAPDYYWEKPFRVFEFWKGGFVSWGGFLGLALSFLIYFRVKKLPALIYLDLFSTAAPVVKFFIRLACLLTGCCYGRPTNLPWAITFTNPASTAYYYFPNTPLHPTQIYSMIHATLLFFFMNWIYPRRRKHPGQSICILAMGWSLPRAFIEFFRGDADRGLYFGGLLSTGQIMGLLITAVALVIYLYLGRQRTSDAS